MALFGSLGKIAGKGVLPFQGLEEVFLVLVQTEDL